MVDTDILLQALETWWRTDIYKKHKDNVKKLKNPSAFNINPFLHPYLANFVYGDTTPLSLAKALVLPRAMSTSVTTTFGGKVQKFIIDNIEHAQGSGIDGIDIEFIDQDNPARPRLYCQVKAGPNTINADDVRTIVDKFTKLRNKARLDGLAMAADSSIVGVIYGTRDELSSSYRKIENTHGYSVHIGEIFWTKLTGDRTFYNKMVEKLHVLSAEVNEEDFMQLIIEQLAETDEILELSRICGS